MVSAGLIPSGDGQVMLVDCGNDPKAKAILVGLSQMGLGHEAVRTILLTHAHPDHIAGCTAFPDAEVFARAAEQSLLEGRTAARSPIGFLARQEKLRYPRHQILTSCRLISTRQRHGDFVLGPRAYRRQRGLSGRGNTLPGRQR
jgi:glyoxylase-like metal-dependent hydrolase (beta-lactamase superfamily II)